MSALVKDPARGVYYYANAANAYQIKQTSGVLKRVIVGTASDSNIALFDDASANNNQFVEIAANLTGSFEFNARFANGLRMVYANSSKVTVVYE